MKTLHQVLNEEILNESIDSYSENEKFLAKELSNNTTLKQQVVKFHSNYVSYNKNALTFCQKGDLFINDLSDVLSKYHFIESKTTNEIRNLMPKLRKEFDSSEYIRKSYDLLMKRLTNICKLNSYMSKDKRFIASKWTLSGFEDDPVLIRTICNDCDDMINEISTYSSELEFDVSYKNNSILEIRFK